MSSAVQTFQLKQTVGEGEEGEVGKSWWGEST